MQNIFENKYIIVLGITLVIFLIFLIVKKLIKHFQKASLRYIDKMTGEEFEEWLAEQFSQMGYEVTFTPKSHDYGADLILERYVNNDNTNTQAKERIIVQAKRYSGKVPVAAVQQAFTAMHFYDGTSCMVITNNYYTEPCVTLANKIGVILWDRDDLIENFNIS